MGDTPERRGYGKLPEHGLSGLIANQLLLHKGPQVRILYFPLCERNPNWQGTVLERRQ